MFIPGIFPGWGREHGAARDSWAHGVPGHPGRHPPDLLQGRQGHEDCHIHKEQQLSGEGVNMALKFFLITTPFVWTN